MASSSPCQHANARLRNSLSFERRPRMLKDFLREDSNSCSSNGFKSLPRKTCNSKLPNFSLPEFDDSLKVIKPNRASPQLLRSRSRAASTTISAIHKASELVISAVKFFPFVSVSVKSSSILPRSISRKMSRRNKNRSLISNEVSVTVKVRDILRWRSFRDLVEEKAEPFDFPYLPNPYKPDTDFTSEDLPSWDSEKVGKKSVLEKAVGGESKETTRIEARRDIFFEENELSSPVSVLIDSPSQGFHRSLSNIDRTKCKLMNRINQLEDLFELESLEVEKWCFTDKHGSCEEDEDEDDEEMNQVEERAKKLLGSLVKETSLHLKNWETEMENLLLDFFRHELSMIRNSNSDVNKVESELLREAKSWISGEYKESFEWKEQDKIVTCVSDMEKVMRWNNFEEQQQEMALELETQMLVDLMKELAIDLRDIFSTTIHF